MNLMANRVFNRFWLWRDYITHPLYFKHPKLRIYIFTRGTYLAPKTRGGSEIFIIRDSWYPEDVVQNTERYWHKYRPDPEKFIFLSNTEEIHKERLRWGINSHYVNIGCFIDENTFTPPKEPLEKIYDAVMNARFERRPDGTETKRHYIANKIPRLALLDPVYCTNDQAAKTYYTSMKNCIFYNTGRLPPGDVVNILRQSHCGLIFSGLEGVCRSSSEYLLCGLPVVSTPSRGGRDVWYDDYNSIIVGPDEDGAAAAAVSEFISHPRDPWKIRRRYLEKAMFFRDRFRDDVLAPILKQHGVDLTAEEVMRTHPFAWWGMKKREYIFSPV
jgi:glycosyltransferase involved in cell wall biosynthesis